jgi:hypothetical protein
MTAKAKLPGDKRDQERLQKNLGLFAAQFKDESCQKAGSRQRKILISQRCENSIENNETAFMNTNHVRSQP